MEFLDNKTNLEALREAVKGAQERIWICSAWIRSETLKKVFDREWLEARRDDLPEIRLLIRMGSSPDYEITDIGNLLVFSREKLKAQVRYLPNLHAKMNIVDESFATVGSFNLTGGGYGDEVRAGSNEEVGLLIEDPAKVKELAEIFQGLWDNATKMGREVVGFTLSEGTNRYVGYVGTREIEIEKLVEIEAEDYDGTRRRWLGQVVTPYAHHAAFMADLSSPEAYQDSQFKRYVEALTDEVPAARLVKVMTLTRETPYSHLRSGRIEVLKEIGEGDGLRFNRVPVPGAALIKEARKELLEGLFCPGASSPIGTLAANPEVQVGLRYPEILTKHMAVFGTTGSGKSYFVKQFLLGFKEWIEEEGGRIIVIDTHDEYSPDNPDFPKELKKEARYIKAEEIRQILSKKVLAEPDEDTDFKAIFGVAFTPDEVGILKDAYREAKKGGTEGDKIQAFLSFVERFTVSDEEVNLETINQLKAVFEGQMDDETLEGIIANELFKAIADAKVKSRGLSGSSKEARELKKEVLGECLNSLKESETTYTSLMERVKENVLSAFLSAYSLETKPPFDPDKFKKIKKALESGQVGFELSDVISLVEEPGLYVLNLRDLDSDEERRATVGDFLSAVFSKARETKGDFKTLVVVEEAHNYAPERSGATSKKVLQRIASEGRKFNVGLVVVTQRPAYIAKDVIAQCNTNVIFRMINSNDINAIASTVEAISEGLLEQLPAFDTGQCIVTGVSVYQPVTIMVKEARA